jgi:hypothetical protein
MHHPKGCPFLWREDQSEDRHVMCVNSTRLVHGCLKDLARRVRLRSSTTLASQPLRALSGTFGSQPCPPVGRSEILSPAFKIRRSRSAPGHIVFANAGAVLGQPRSAKAPFSSVEISGHHLYQVGWQAIPIMALVTFLIGAIIASRHLSFPKIRRESYVVGPSEFSYCEIGVSRCHHGRRRSGCYTAELRSIKCRNRPCPPGLDPSKF